VSAAANFQLRRSVLYVPGSNERALAKAASLPCDVVILDLEDAVAPAEKIAARQRVCEIVRAGRLGPREVAIRVNAIDSPWHVDDIEAAAAAKPSAILAPKVNAMADVDTIERELDAAGAGQDVQIWAMIETPLAILNAAEIAGSSKRLTALVAGVNDLTKELRAEDVPGRAPLLFALSVALLAARSAGKAALDGVFDDISDAAGFEAECLQSRQLGFDGKTLIHPSQIDPCNRVFTPSVAEIERAEKTIAAFERAVASGRGVATLDGRLIENLHVESARRILAMGQEIAAGSRSTLPRSFKLDDRLID
jgi:citrate lyase subunit beta / citryl-CoA lyase